MRSVLSFPKRMKRCAADSLLCALMLWVAVCMPLIHPLFHNHDSLSSQSTPHFCGKEHQACTAGFYAHADIERPSGHQHGFCPICHFFSHFAKFLLLLATGGLVGPVLFGPIRLSISFIFTPSQRGLFLPRAPPFSSLWFNKQTE